jgi:hypothetical protein
VPFLAAVILAPCIAAPLESVMVPLILPSPWAFAWLGISNASAHKIVPARLIPKRFIIAVS